MDGERASSISWNASDGYLPTHARGFRGGFVGRGGGGRRIPFEAVLGVLEGVAGGMERNMSTLEKGRWEGGCMRYSRMSMSYYCKEGVRGQ